MIWLIIQFILGVLLLAKAADWFCRAAAQVAELTGLPRLVLGATLVGFATNLPEFSISTMAAWRLHSEIALGNPIGSNICNTGLILGICLVRSRGVIEMVWLRDHGIPMLLACTLLVGIAAWSDITAPVALLFLVLLVAYVAWSLASARREPVLAWQARSRVEEALGETGSLKHRWAVAGVLLALSIPLVIFSSRWVLGTSVQLARMLQISESVIALTLIAGGTSLPELATALAALRRGHQDTSVGIVLGSNIYNALGVIGISGLITRLPVTLGNRLFDMPVMLLVIAIPLVPCLFGKSPGRITGMILIGLYAAYTYSMFTLYGVFV
jgi:cation:H+ antiporter